MPGHGLEVADVFRHFGQAFRDQHGASLSAARHRAMLAIERCRTAALGGHVERCGDCGRQRIAYNSCRNRNCLKWQGLEVAAEILDIGGDVQRLDVSQLADVVTVAPGEEPADRGHVGLPGVLVADGGGEEFQEAPGGVLAGVGEQGGELSFRGDPLALPHPPLPADFAQH